MEQRKIKLLVGMACLGISYEAFTSWNSFWTDLIRTANFEVGCSFKYRKPVIIAQEDLAKEAVDSGCTHLLIIDDDVLDYKLTDLIKLLEANLDMVGGVMLTRRFPFHTTAMRRLDNSKPIIEHAKNVTGFDMYEVPKADQTGIRPVDLLSFGFTLFRTELFKKMKRPYFIPDPSMIDESKCNYQYQTYTDSIFCDKVYAVGSQPYAHFDVWLNHNGVTKDNVHAWIEIYKQSGMLTQPGITLNDKEFLEYKMIAKARMERAEARFNSQAIEKMKWFMPTGEVAKEITGEANVPQEGKEDKTVAVE